MLSLRIKRGVSICTFLVTAAAFLPAAYSQNKKNNSISTGEKGLLSVYNYSTKTYKAAPQNWAIVQDKRGVLYVGNNDGILEYDGVSWRLLKVSNETNVRSLAIDKTGRVFVGASSEVGFLEPDNSGNIKYHSLCSHIDKKDLDFSDIWSTLSAKDGIYFQAENKIFRWDGKSMKVWNAEKSFHRIFQVNGHIFVREREIGLLELVNDQLVTLKGGEAFAEESIYGMIPFYGDSSQNILVCTKKKGLYILKLGQNNNMPSIVLEKFTTQIDPFLVENVCYNLLKINSFYSIATVTNGAATINNHGDLQSYLNKQMGLQDETVYSQNTDASGNLWLATSNGMSRVNISSPVTSFSDKNGLGGNVLDIVRYNNTLFAATSLGVYFLHPGSISNGTSLTSAAFEKLESIKEECWDLHPFKTGKSSVLLGVSSGNIFSIDEHMNTKEVLRCRPWRVYQSSVDSSRVYIGLENGLTSIYWDGKQWIEEATIADINESVHSIAEDSKGDLWLGHNAGAIKISFKDNAKAPRKKLEQGSFSLSKYDTTSGLPDRTVEIESMNGQIIFGTSNAVYTFTNNKFVKQELFTPALTDVRRQIHRVSYNSSTQDIWLETHLPVKYKFEFGYLHKEKDGNYSWNITPFLPYSDEVIHSIYHDDNGITWFGGSEGLYRYDANADSHENKAYNAIIRKVTIGRDSAIFNGAYFDSSNLSSLTQNASLKSTLSFADNSIIFEFSSLDFTNEQAEKYQYFLEGFDKGWSNWKHETKAVYTNLPEGHHIFHVRAKNVFNQESNEAVYEFSVLPPWYRTWWAYISYFLLSVGFVAGVVTFFTRGLKRIIQERTAEVVKQKEVIEYKNRNITDSINYAKRIQEAILPSKELMRNRFPESFILYRPKDIVAGDFYWFAEKDKKFIVAACDCTGHGVPGAFMSLISYSLLNEVLLEKSFTSPAAALDTMKKGIIKSLGQTGQEGEQKDGMDMSLVSLEVNLEGGKINNKLSFAGANNPLYLIRKGELMEFPADKMPIGIYGGIERPFTNKEFSLESGDTFYLFSDGYADNFGGNQGKKFTKKRFKELLLTIQAQPMNLQRNTLESTMDTWLGDQQQIDDVLVIGIRIS